MKHHGIRRSRSRFAVGTLAASMVASILGLAPAAEATTWNVKCDEDRLIQAIENANNNGVSDVIKLAKNCKYEFDWAYGPDGGTSALPDITEDLVIEGNGAKIIRDDDDDSQDFRIMTIAGADVVIKKLTVTGGYITDPAGAAGIQVDGSLTASELKVLDNTIYSIDDMTADSALGAGISCDSCVLALTKSTVAGNVAQTISLDGGATTFGGGISTGDNAIATILKTSVKGNEARARGSSSSTALGGGIYAFGSILDLDDAKVTGNLADSSDGDSIGHGGGVYTVGALVTMSDTVVSGNTVTSNGPTARGGGMYLATSDTTISESEITKNSVTVSGDGSTAWGGGILQQDGDLDVDGGDEDESSEIDGNTARASGFGSAAWGGGYLVHDGGTATFNFTEFTSNSVRAPEGTARGGAVYAADGTTVTLNQAEVEDNSASGLVEEGGGVYAEVLTDVEVDLSEFDDNSPYDCFSGDSGEFC